MKHYDKPTSGHISLETFPASRSVCELCTKRKPVMTEGTFTVFPCEKTFAFYRDRNSRTTAKNFLSKSVVVVHHGLLPRFIEIRTNIKDCAMKCGDFFLDLLIVPITIPTFVHTNNASQFVSKFLKSVISQSWIYGLQSSTKPSIPVWDITPRNINATCVDVPRSKKLHESVPIKLGQIRATSYIRVEKHKYNGKKDITMQPRTESTTFNPNYNYECAKPQFRSHFTADGACKNTITNCFFEIKNQCARAQISGTIQARLWYMRTRNSSGYGRQL